MERPKSKSIYSKEHCEAISKGHLGKKHSDETKQKMKDAWIKRKEKKQKTITVEVIQ